MAEAFAIRAAAPGDHAAMAPLFERFYREEGLAEAVDVVAGNLHDVIARHDTAAFVAEASGEAVGVAAVSTSFGLEAGRYAELEDLYVVPEWRRHGVASALVESAVDWARGRGCRDVEVVLTPHAQATSGLTAWYAGRGFADTGRRILEKRLD